MKNITNKQLNQLVSALDEYQTESVSVNIGESVLSIEVKPLLTVDEFSAYVRSVVDAVFDESGYRADVLSYAMKKATIAFYTNLGSGFNNKVLNALIYATDLFHVIGSVINADQYRRVEAAIYSAIGDRQKVVYAEHQYGAEQIKAAMVAEQNELNAGIESLLKQIKEISEQFNPETQRVSLDFMKRVNSMDDKTLIDNIVEFNQASKSGDVNGQH